MKTKKSKYENRKTSINLKGVYGDVHCSICYENDEPNTLSFSQYIKEENGELKYHHIPLYNDDLNALFEILKENEIIN